MILVTGANGFVGRHFLKELSRFYERSQITLLTSVPVDGYQCMVYQDWTFDHDLQSKLKALAPSLVFHLGATTPRDSRQADFMQATANILFTASLISAVSSAAKFVFTSTLDVYGRVDGTVTEATPCLPATLYGHSKLYCEKMIETWAETSNKICQIIRLGHVYGPGEEHYGKFLPVALRQAAKGETIEVWGDGSETRSFIHVEDACSAILKASQLASFAGPINVCGSRQVTINQVITIIRQFAPEVNVQHLPARSQKVNFVFDTTKMASLLGVEQVTLEAGLHGEFQYFKNMISGL